MEERRDSAIDNEKILKEAPQLVQVLKEMKEGLDTVTSRTLDLTAKVKSKQLQTAGGLSYLEAKHLLLVNYCQSLIYYLLRKAQGLSIEGHPVVRSLVEIRLFLEKIRPIDKKCAYWVERLLKTAATDGMKVGDIEEKATEAGKSEDLLTYRPNPDMLVRKTDVDADDNAGVYRPPKIAPTTMEEGKKAKLERDAERKSKDLTRKVRTNDYLRELIDDMEGKPQEVRESIGPDSRELSKYIQKWEKREQQEEELFNRAPITKAEKKKMKALMRSNGLLGLTDNFFEEMNTLPFKDGSDEQKEVGFGTSSSMERTHKKRKRKY